MWSGVRAYSLKSPVYGMRREAHSGQPFEKCTRSWEVVYPLMLWVKSFNVHA